MLSLFTPAIWLGIRQKTTYVPCELCSTISIYTNTDDAIAGVYLTVSMAVTSISIIMTVFVLNIYHCSPHQTELSPWIRRLVLGKLARLVRCRPTKLCRQRRQASKSTGKRIASKLIVGRKPEVQGNRRLVLESFGAADDASLERFGDSLDAKCGVSGVVQRHFDLPDYIPLTSDDNNRLNHNVIPSDQGGGVNDVTPHEVKMLTAVEEIVRHLRFFINKQDMGERQSDIIDEWRQVTLVIDQCLFWIFTLTTVVYTTLLLIIVPLARGR